MATLLTSIPSLYSARKTLLGVLFFGSQLALSACGSDSGGAVEPQIPLVAFSESINITNQQYVNLRSDNGATYVTGGVRGLIVVRQNSSTYYAFERNCPYRANDTCARVQIDPSRLFLKDPCCGSQFDLQGRVQQGPASRALRQYNTSLSGNLLTITN
ncbi:Rieske 2Fe-2S domain-containing protein [Hymenobacter sediminicola]|uniref:Rieske 2Fe-2S domain-containing protein n=1 Tax=Hymenobacter sediminicola TaxID=2761579 RepID=A0A7G7W883_9BACT|nr:Rieske 2Fe-2S domain-containing protein [Hymenobacter sediminicola]QNH62576.1 Rieske 2Fe-2S domain-containing protein [Hymenobacter sediminicola]